MAAWSASVCQGRGLWAWRGPGLAWRVLGVGPDWRRLGLGPRRGVGPGLRSQLTERCPVVDERLGVMVDRGGLDLQDHDRVITGGSL